MLDVIFGLVCVSLLWLQSDEWYCFFMVVLVFMVGTFFVFSNYLLLPAVRMAALQNLPVTYVMTHDSVAVGEDGPTHEPIEQLASVRSMPNN